MGGTMQTENRPQAELSTSFARDALLAWFRSEFAAANAIIDALCTHVAEIEGGNGKEYASVFAAIHRRRMHWIDVLQMQKYHSIAEVTMELKKVAETKNHQRIADKIVENVAFAEEVDQDSPDSEITDGGSQGTQSTAENIEICSNHEDCDARPNQIKLRKGFMAREPVKGYMVNVVKGLKLYEDVFTDSELSKLSDFVHDLQISGRNGELPGETFRIFNEQVKGNKRESIQFGEPVFKQIRDTRNNIEQIPSLLQNVIHHLVQWHLIPNKMPNSCIINFFDEGEYSQPYVKPPHVDEPVTTLVLSDSTMAFGCTLVCDIGGNYKAPQILSLKKGSLLVMRGNSAKTAAHAMCPSPTKRVAITFFRVRSETTQNQSMLVSPNLDGATTVRQPRMASPHSVAHLYNPLDTMLNFGVMYAPVPILPLPRPMSLNPRHIPGCGTGVFLPWTVIPPNQIKYLPPRAQNGRSLTLSSAEANQKTEFSNTSPVSKHTSLVKTM